MEIIVRIILVLAAMGIVAMAILGASTARIAATRARSVSSAIADVCSTRRVSK